MDTWLFQDDDHGFHSWLDDHPDGYFINLDRARRGPFILHAAPCPHFDRDPSLHWTREYIKVCGETQFILERWAQEEALPAPTRCSTCL